MVYHTPPFLFFFFNVGSFDNSNSQDSETGVTGKKILSNKKFGYEFDNTSHRISDIRRNSSKISSNDEGQSLKDELIQTSNRRLSTVENTSSFDQKNRVSAESDKFKKNMDEILNNINNNNNDHQNGYGKLIDEVDDESNSESVSINKNESRDDTDGHCSDESDHSDS